MVRINGMAVNAAGKTLQELLASSEYDAGRVAIERNGEIVPRSRYGEVVLVDGDVIEIVSFVGGG